MHVRAWGMKVGGKEECEKPVSPAILTQENNSKRTVNLAVKVQSP